MPTAFLIQNLSVMLYECINGVMLKKHKICSQGLKTKIMALKSTHFILIAKSEQVNYKVNLSEH